VLYVLVVVSNLG